eukprot:6207769-Pleurochrysis_carterae.AAC.2
MTANRAVRLEGRLEPKLLRWTLLTPPCTRMCAVKLLCHNVQAQQAISSKSALADGARLILKPHQASERDDRKAIPSPRAHAPVKAKKSQRLSPRCRRGHTALASEEGGPRFEVSSVAAFT